MWYTICGSAQAQGKLLKGDASMATSSILKEIKLKDRSSSKDFISALERAERSKSVEITRPTVTRLKREEITSFLEKDKEICG